MNGTQVKTKNDKAVFGIFRNQSEVKFARSMLNARGFQNSEISIMYPNHPGDQDFSQNQRSELKNGAQLGAAIGAVLLFSAAVLFSARRSALDLSTTSTNTPQFYQLIVLCFLGLIIGAILGAACGALVGIGIPEPARNRYRDYVEAGGILMSVHAETENKRTSAQSVFEQSGAQDVNVINEKPCWDLVFSRHYLQ